MDCQYNKSEIQILSVFAVHTVGWITFHANIPIVYNSILPFSFPLLSVNLPRSVFNSFHF